jgi:hypothetical protein
LNEESSRPSKKSHTPPDPQACSDTRTVTQDSLSEESPHPPKKSYHPPEFRVYGDIRAITQTIPHTGTVVDTNFPPGIRMKTR